MPSIADLFITVSSDVTGAVNGLSTVDQKINGTSSAMAAATPVAFALAGAATAVGAEFLSTVNAASDFEHQINGIKSVMSPAEVQEFGGAVHDLALALGAETVFSAAQAADGIQELIKAGVPLPAILGGAARSALDLAAATGVDVAQAAALASAAMNTYHVSAEALPGIMDTIANVSNATATSVSALQFGLAAVGPVAAGLGLSFNDTATALGIFANNGLQGSDAGTSLKTMLLNLEPATKAQKQAFYELGLFTEEGANKFFDANGAARSMSDVFEILKTSTANLTAEQKTNLLQTAFGTDAVRAALIAANEGAAGWDNVTAAMEKMGGTAVAAAQRNSGLQGATTSLSGSLETLQITIGERFLPILTAATNALVPLINGFMTLDPNVQTAIIAAVGIAGALAGVTAAIVLLGPLLTGMVAGFGLIAGAAAPVLAVLAALGAAAYVMYQAWETNFGGIREVVAESLDAIQPAIVNIQNFVSALGDALGPAVGNVMSALAPFVSMLSDALRPILAQIPGLIRATGDEFNAISAFVQQAIAVFQQFATAVSLEDKLRILLDLLGQLAGGIGNVIGAIAGGDFQGAWNAFVQTFVDLGPRVQPLWNDFLSWLGGVLSQLPQFVADSMGFVWNALLTAFNDLVPNLEPFWNAFAQWFGTMLGYLPQFVADTIGNVWGALVATFEALVPLLAPAWDVFGGWFGAVLGGLGQFVADHAGDVFGWIVGQADALVQRLEGALGPLADWLASTFGNFWNWLTTGGEIPAPGGGTTGGGTGTLPSPGTSGPIVYVGTLVISSQEEANNFLNLVAQAVLESARRVTPPTGGANPALA